MLPASQGFFYNQYPAPNITGFNALGTNTGENKNQQLWYHVVGTPQDQDIFVLALPEQPLWSLSAGYTLDKQWAPVPCPCTGHANLVPPR